MPTITVHGVEFPVLDDCPEYAVAHPDEHPGILIYEGEATHCDKCALALRPDTGEIVLLWCCGGINWSLSRETPDYERHRNELFPEQYRA